MAFSIFLSHLRHIVIYNIQKMLFMANVNLFCKLFVNV